MSSLTGNIFPKAKLPTPFRRQPLTKKSNHYGEGSGPLAGCQYALSYMQGWRVTQEDAHVHVVPLRSRRDIAFFGVFDGHGGDKASAYAAENVLSFIENSDSFGFLNRSGTNPNDGPSPEVIARATLEGFFNCDEAMKETPLFKNGQDPSGSTGVVCSLTPNCLIVGNTGDSRCILVRSDAVVFASHDHKPQDARETARVENAGGSVRFGRINGDLASARSFGDFRYKTDMRLPASQQQVTVMPDIAILDRSPEDQLLILACDGIWDVMSNLECAQFALSALRLGASCVQAAELILDECLRKSSGDNMSVLIVALDNAPKEMGTSRQPVKLEEVRDRMYSSVL